MANSSSIAAYTFAADIHAPSCVVGAMVSTDQYDGWGLAEGCSMTVEDNLDEIAEAFQIDRMDETTFDSGFFPKVVFQDQVEEDEACACGTALEDH